MAFEATKPPAPHPLCSVLMAGNALCLPPKCRLQKPSDLVNAYVLVDTGRQWRTL